MIRIYNDRDVCFLCGGRASEMHHIFHGNGLRKLSDYYGLVVPLCHQCHNEPPNGAHFNAEVDTYLKREGQWAFEREYGHAKFMRVFGRNYLEEGDWREVE